MPTCLACAKGWPITTGSLYAANSRRSISRWAASRTRVLGGELFYRNRNHTVSARSRGLSKGVSSPTHQTLTLLEKATSFLDQGGSEKVSFWRGALSELSVGDPKARVTVYGADEWSGARDLVTVLLTDPLTSNKSQEHRLRDRWKDQPKELEALTIEALDPLEKNEDKSGDLLKLSSSWFSRFSLPIKLIETLPSDPSLSIPPAILIADIPIFLLNPVTTPVSSLLKWDSLLNNPNAIILLTTFPSSPLLIQHILSSTAKQGGAVIMFVDPGMALRATEALREDPKAPRNVEEYRTKYMDSHVGDVNTAISNILRNAGSLSRLRQQTALNLVRTIVESAERDLDSVCTRVSELKSQVEDAKMVARKEVLGCPEIHKTMKHAEKEMKEIMDALTMWTMLGSVDEIGTIVGNGIRKVWCRMLEDKLIFETGRLSAVQSTLTRSLPKTIPSQILQNSLLQISSSPSYPLQPTTLTGPLLTRRNQLIDYPTTRLHLAAQNATLGVLGGFLAGTGSAVYVVNAFVVEGSAGTAVGVFMLCTVLGVRWAVGKWERAKRRWWEDWFRVVEGLERDLEATLDQTMESKVTVVADRAAEGLDSLVSKRKAEIEELKDALV